MPTFRFLVKFTTGMPIGFAASRNSRAMSSGGLFPRVTASHGGCTFPLAIRADMRFSLALLLRRLSLSFFSLRATQVAAIALLAVIFRGAGFAERNRLPATLDLASLAATASLQFTVLELVHHPAGVRF